MNKDSLPFKIFVAVEVALVVLARVLKGTFPTLCIVLYSIFGILLVVGLGWYIVSLVRHGVPAEEEPKQTPKWRSLLFAVCAMMIIVGTVFPNQPLAGCRTDAVYRHGVVAGNLRSRSL